jgi:hypothetical protein
MTSRVARSVADSAPVAYTRELQLLADPQLRSDLTMVNARPGQIKKLKVEQAQRVVELVDDPAVLAGIRRAEKRRKIRFAIEAHPLGRTIPHAQWCQDCAEIKQGVTSLAEFDELLAAHDGCPLVPVRVIELSTGEQLTSSCWMSVTNSSNSQRVSAAVAWLLVAGIAGRLSPELPWVRAILDRSGSNWSVERFLQDLIPREARLNIELVRHWFNRRAELPQGNYSAELLIEIAHELPTSGAVYVGMRDKLLNEDHIREMWPVMQMRQRIDAIQSTADETFIIWALEQLAEDHEFNQQNHSSRFESTVQILGTFPQLSTRHRLITLSAGEYDSLVRFAFGELGVSPRPGEVRAAATALFERNGQLERTLDYAKTLSGRYEARLVRPSVRELVEILFERTNAQLVLVGSSPVTQLAHQRLWSELRTEAERNTALGLLESWDANLDSLVTTVKLLEDGP